MGCIRPNLAIQAKAGTKPDIKKRHHLSEERQAAWGQQPFELRLPCGRCIGCRLEQRRGWAIRSMHEAQLHERNCFLTLTYDQPNVPYGLVKSDFQNFMKRWREYRSREHKARGQAGSPEPVRYLMSGEYGDKTGRPHFHALIFGENFADTATMLDEKRGVYHSSQVAAHWHNKGFNFIGNITFDSASYVASYTTKKVGERDGERICPVTGECFSAPYATMSRRQGLASKWLDKYNGDVWPEDAITLKDGRKFKPPKFYDLWLKTNKPELHEEVMNRRRNFMRDNKEKFDDEALTRREKIYESRMKRILNETTI